MMPVEGDRKPATPSTSGSSAASSSRSSQPQIVDAVDLGLFPVFLQAVELRLVAGDDHLADALVVDVMLGAVAVERFFAGDAQLRLHRAGRIIDAGVDDFGIARAGMGAECVLGFEDHHFATGLRESARDGEADDAGADDCAVDSFCHNSVSVACANVHVMVTRRPADVAPGRPRDESIAGVIVSSGCGIFRTPTWTNPWDPDFVMRSPMFEPLRPLGAALRSPQWPTLD